MKIKPYANPVNINVVLYSFKNIIVTLHTNAYACYSQDKEVNMELNEIKCSVCPYKESKESALAAVKEEMCDKYCRFCRLVGITEEALVAICDECPLNNLIN